MHRPALHLCPASPFSQIDVHPLPYALLEQ
jgi:hypothetical protein